MKSKITFLTTFALLYLALATNAQKFYYPKPNSDQIAFGKKLPPPPTSERDAAIEKMYGKKYMDLLLIRYSGNLLLPLPVARVYSFLRPPLTVIQVQYKLLQMQKLLPQVFI
jgi:hypothetical protein